MIYEMNCDYGAIERVSVADELLNDEVIPQICAQCPHCRLGGSVHRVAVYCAKNPHRKGIKFAHATGEGPIQSFSPLTYCPRIRERLGAPRDIAIEGPRYNGNYCVPPFKGAGEPYCVWYDRPDGKCILYNATTDTVTEEN